MITEEQKFASQRVIWQELFGQAQSNWMSGDRDRAGEYFQRLIEQTTRLLLWVASQKVSSAYAEDIVAEAHLELYEKMIEGETVNNVGGLLRTITCRRAVDLSKKASTKHEYLAGDEYWARYADVDAAAPINVEDEVTTHLIVNPLLDELPPDLREVLLARHGLGMTVEQTAEHLGWTVDQVKKRTKKALARAIVFARQKGLLS